MGEIKIFDSELLLMEYLWEHGPCIAADLAEEFLKRYNWKKSTTYIVLKRLEGKGAISREEPKYLVTPIVTILVGVGAAWIIAPPIGGAASAFGQLVERMFGGSFASLFANFLNSDQLSEKTLDELQALIDEKRSKN